MANHFLEVCTCGVVLAQCRCPDLNKPRIVKERACPTCQTMRLPPGETCSTCAHWKKTCEWLICSRTGGEIDCDWAPSRFKKHGENQSGQ